MEPQTARRENRTATSWQIEARSLPKEEQSRKRSSRKIRRVEAGLDTRTQARANLRRTCQYVPASPEATISHVPGSGTVSVPPHGPGFVFFFVVDELLNASAAPVAPDVFFFGGVGKHVPPDGKGGGAIGG